MDLCALYEMCGAFFDLFVSIEWIYYLAEGRTKIKYVLPLGSDYLHRQSATFPSQYPRFAGADPAIPRRAFTEPEQGTNLGAI